MINMGTIYEQNDICIKKQLMCARLLGLESNDDLYYYQGYDKITNMFMDVMCERTECPPDKQVIDRIIKNFTKCRKQFAESHKKKIKLFRK